MKTIALILMMAFSGVSQAARLITADTPSRGCRVNEAAVTSQSANLFKVQVFCVRKENTATFEFSTLEDAQSFAQQTLLNDGRDAFILDATQKPAKLTKIYQ